MAETKLGTEVQAHILQKVEADAEFREHLMADPKGVIEAETGVDLPDDALVFVQEAIATAQQGVSSIDAPLTEDELIQVMGGDCANPQTTNEAWNCMSHPGYWDPNTPPPS